MSPPGRHSGEVETPSGPLRRRPDRREFPAGRGHILSEPVLPAIPADRVPPWTGGGGGGALLEEGGGSFAG